MDREELAWAAGFFDGEGYVSAPVRNGRVTLHLSVNQKDRQVLDRFRHAILELGYVRGPYSHLTPSGRKTEFFMYSTSSYTAQAVVALLWHFLSPIKRDQATKALSAFKGDMVNRKRVLRRVS